MYPMKFRLILSILAVAAIAGVLLWVRLGKGPDATFQATTDQSTAISAIVEINSSQYSVEVADNPEKHGLGLSFRENLPKGTGMLFIFDLPSRPSFWMREMKFPLDLVWINEQNTVIDITRNAPKPKPNTKEDDLPLYTPKENIIYVLEINAGESSAIKVGDKVKISNIRSL